MTRTLADIIQFNQPSVWNELCRRYPSIVRKGKVIRLTVKVSDQSEPVGGELARAL